MRVDLCAHAVTYMCAYVHVYARAWERVCISVHLCMCSSVPHACVSMCLCVCVYVSVGVRARMHVISMCAVPACVSVSLCVYVCV